MEKTINAEALKSWLLRQRITAPRFRLEMDGQTACTWLEAAYRAEVEYRQRAYHADADTLDNIKRFAHFLTQERPKFGAMFCGTTGNGKTTLLRAFQNIVNCLRARGAFRELEQRGYHVGFEIIDAKTLAWYLQEPKRFEELASRDMVAIDDMGREAVEVVSYGNVLNPLNDIVEARYDRQKFTLITTNLTPRQITEKYGKRVADRFNEMMEVIIFKHSSYRS